MTTSSNGNIFHFTGPLWGESTDHWWTPLTSPVTRSFDVFFDLRLNKRLSKPSRRRWFEMPSRSLWRHCYDILRDIGMYLREILSHIVPVVQRHDTATLSAALALCEGIYLSRRHVTQGCEVFVIVSRNKLLKDQSIYPWFETAWRTCVFIIMYAVDSIYGNNSVFQKRAPNLRFCPISLSYKLFSVFKKFEEEWGGVDTCCLYHNITVSVSRAKFFRRHYYNEELQDIPIKFELRTDKPWVK